MPSPTTPSSLLPTPSHYALLQLDPGASPQDLRQSFRNLSKRFHPDTTTLPAAEAAAAFQRLQEAYAVLSDPQRRQAYDAQLRRAAALAAVAPVSRPAAPSRVTPRPVPVRRPLSGGEWFALLLLGCALVLSLVLGLGLAWARGVEMIQRPSWWVEAAPLPPVKAATAQPGERPASQTEGTAAALHDDGEPDSSRDPSLQAPLAPTGGVAAPAGREPVADGSIPVGSAPAPLERPDRAGS
ncbi:J domain-containing protein [Synechococcus sp. CBW1006]|uniref:J domain-containing protein n=1 Tax=Synechococcus sp. CBW1006 TaxID=1353138 RepID=UPI001E63ECA4|nr:J domain-containing protein [Synechococcus sp. CBW1006]